MTIGTPTLVSGNLTFGLTGVVTAVTSWYLFKTADTSGASDPTTISSYLDKYFPIKVITNNTSTFAFRDLDYNAGEFTLYLKDAAGWDKIDFEITDAQRTTGINFPVTIKAASEKQPTPVVDSQDIKGAPKYFSDFEQFLLLPQEHMTPNMIVTVRDEETNTVKQFVLDRNGVDLGNGTFGPLVASQISSIPYPLLKADISDTRSFSRYWSQLSESQEIVPAAGVIRYYAPDYEDGVPPLYDNSLTGQTPGVDYPAGLNVPDGASFQKNREFLGVWSWDAPTSQFVNANAPTSVYFSQTQVTKTQKVGDKWFIESVDGISFTRWRRIGAFDTGSVTQNRYIRRVTDVLDPYGTLTGGDNKFPSTPLTFRDGVRNRFGLYDDNFLQSTTLYDLEYTDVPPALRVNKAGLGTQESAMYDDFVADGVTTLDVDGLWEILCIKDKYNRLESDFETARYIPNNGDLVRYSANRTPDINDLDAADYVANGWVTEFDPSIHRYKAERNNTGENFQIVLISAEIGTYIERVFKAYPIRYVDRITNAATAGNYTPTGIGAAINAGDDVDDTFTWTNQTPEVVSAPNNGAWVDSIFAAPLGWVLFVSEATFYFGGDRLETSWSQPELFGTDPVVIDSITGQENFKSTTVIDDDNNEVTTYDPTTIDLVANLTLFTQRETDSGNQYILNDDVNETIKYKWERIFNNGSADTTIIFDNTSTADASELISEGDLVGGAFTYNDGSNDLYRIEDSGRTCRIYPDGLDTRAIYKLTQERTTEGGTISYEEETAGLLDIADGLPSKTVVVSGDKPFFILKGDAESSGGVWQFDDYVNPVNGASHPQIVLRAFIQNVNAGNWYRWSSGQDFDTVRNDVISGSETKENSVSATYWASAGSNVTKTVTADDTEFNDDTVNKTVIYKYQTGAYYDIIRISRIQEGADVRDLDLKTSSLVISYNSGETDYSPASQVVEYRVINQNASSAGINWEIIDKTGADISGDITLYDQSSGGSPISDGDTVAYLRVADYPSGNPTEYNKLLNNLPITVRVTHDDYASLVDFSTIRKISDGADGPAGTDAIVAVFTNEAENQSCDEDGVPINANGDQINGNLNIKTSIQVFEGLSDVTTSYDLNLSDLTAVDEDNNAVSSGTSSNNYTAVLSNSNRTLNITRIPEDSNKLILTCTIRRVSDNLAVGTRTLTITKALVGATGLRASISDEGFLVKHNNDGGVDDNNETLSIGGVSGVSYLGSFEITGYRGTTPITKTFNQSINDSIVAWNGSAAAFNNSFSGTNANFSSNPHSYNVVNGGYTVRFIQDDGDKIHVVVDNNGFGVDFDQQFAFQDGNEVALVTFSIRWLNVGYGQYQVLLFSSDPSFHANEPNSAQRILSAKIVTAGGVETTTLPSGWSLNTDTGTTRSAESGFTSSWTILKSDINVSKLISVSLLDNNNNIVSRAGITFYDLRDASAFQELYYSTNSTTFPARPSGDYSSFPNSANNQWGRIVATDFDKLYLSRRSEYDTDWSYPIQVKGEAGEQGGLRIPIRIYKVSTTLPAIPGDPAFPTGSDFTTFDAPAGWTKVPEYQGFSKLWTATGYLVYENDIWSFVGPWEISLLGAEESLREVYVYRGSSTENPAWVNDFNSPQSQFPQSGGVWVNSIKDVSTNNFIYRARGYYANGELQRRVLPADNPVVELNASVFTAISGVTGVFQSNDSPAVLTGGNLNDYYWFNNLLYQKTDAGNNYWTQRTSYFWDQPELIAQEGVTGATGPTGATGATGATGPAGPGGLMYYAKAILSLGAGQSGHVYVDLGSTFFSRTFYYKMTVFTGDLITNELFSMRTSYSNVEFTNPSQGTQLISKTVNQANSVDNSSDHFIVEDITSFNGRYLQASVAATTTLGASTYTVLLEVRKLTGVGTKGDGTEYTPSS